MSWVRVPLITPLNKEDFQRWISSFFVTFSCKCDAFAIPYKYRLVEAVKVRKSTASRLDNALLECLKTEAKRENRSLNSLVEAILMDAMYCVPNAETYAMYCVPNAETLAAIEEARSAKKKEVFDNVKDLMDELMK